MKVNHIIVGNIYVSIMSFNTIHENKILANISEFTVPKYHERVQCDYQCYMKILLLLHLSINKEKNKPNIMLGVHRDIPCTNIIGLTKLLEVSQNIFGVLNESNRVWYGKCSKISNFLFLFSNCYQGWNSQNTCQNSKQGRPRSD